MALRTTFRGVQVRGALKATNWHDCFVFRQVTSVAVKVLCVVRPLVRSIPATMRACKVHREGSRLACHVAGEHDDQQDSASGCFASRSLHSSQSRTASRQQRCQAWKSDLLCGCLSWPDNSILINQVGRMATWQQGLVLSTPGICLLECMGQHCRPTTGRTRPIVADVQLYMDPRAAIPSRWP